MPGRKQYKLWLPGPVAQRIRHLTTNQGIAGSSPARVNFFAPEIFVDVKKIAPPGGLEPPTFRLTAERASRLRHGGKAIVERLYKGGFRTHLAGIDHRSLPQQTFIF